MTIRNGDQFSYLQRGIERSHSCAVARDGDSPNADFGKTIEIEPTNDAQGKVRFRVLLTME